MIYFFHHYELPVIIQQSQLQQLIRRSRQQQQQQNNRPNRQGTPPSPATTAPSAEAAQPNINLTTTTNDNNNNNQNTAFNIRTFLSQRIQLRRIVHPLSRIRNILTNGVPPNNLNNNRRLRMINFHNLRQINLGTFQISPTNQAASIQEAPPPDLRDTYQRNFEENNFQLSGNDNDIVPSGTANGIVPDTAPESQTETFQTQTSGSETSHQRSPLTNILSDGLNEKNNSLRDSYEIQLIENNTTKTISRLADNDASSTVNATTFINEPSTMPSAFNEMSNQLPLLEKIETRDDDIGSVEQHSGNTNSNSSYSHSSTTTIPTCCPRSNSGSPSSPNNNSNSSNTSSQENLFTQSSSKEICSSNKGDTGNCNGVDECQQHHHHSHHHDAYHPQQQQQNNNCAKAIGLSALKAADTVVVPLVAETERPKTIQKDAGIESSSPLATGNIDCDLVESQD